MDIKGFGSRMMSGLKVVDDHTFTIELKRPFGPFTQKLGHVAFSPLPDSVLKNPASFRREPVGNGPFRVVTWAPGTETELERYDGYAGRAKARVGKITYRAYSSDEAAYALPLPGAGRRGAACRRGPRRPGDQARGRHRPGDRHPAPAGHERRPPQGGLDGDRP
ncbi:hypothetical protein B1L11_06050 [Microbispora sp. GKU 823]|nr:hypothetical protein B1L11_06050 [Microbispora sp. GKU 823]